MIDLHLLLRISSENTEFRKRVMTKIYAKGQAFERDLRNAIGQGKWNNCFYQLQGFYNQITPYGQLSFLEQINDTMSALLHETDSAQKAAACNRILHLVETGLQSINPMTMRPQDTPATRQMAS